MKKSFWGADKLKSNLSFFLVFLIFGFIIVMQVKSVKNNYKALNSEELTRATELSDQLLKEKEKNTGLSKEIAAAKDELDKFRTEAGKSGDYAKVLAKQLERVELTAGMAAVKGPGVSITLKDSKSPAGGTASPNQYVVHDSDLLSIVNELRDAGAEAISINGERLIATSEIRCAGSVVSVNNNRYSAPFVISAIGDRGTMENALKMRGGVVDSLAIWDIEVSIEKKDEITINAYNGTVPQKYAVPVKTGK